MAKRSLTVGGTPGATLRGGTLEEFVSIQFHFDADAQATLLSLLSPCDAWLDQFRAGAVELVATPEIAIIMTIESCGVRFVRSRVTPARVPEQREYLEQVEAHSSALIELLALNPQMEGTTADIARFMRKAHSDRGTTDKAALQQNAVFESLLTLKFFAKYVLTRNVEPQPYERREQETKRRTTYRRFILIADLLSAFARITGEEPTAYVSETARGRKVSKAIAFLQTAMPPIVKAARLDWPPMSPDLLKKDLIEVKQFWTEGLRPELAYALPGWGRRFD